MLYQRSYYSSVYFMSVNIVCSCCIALSSSSMLLFRHFNQRSLVNSIYILNKLAVLIGLSVLPPTNY